MTAINNSRCNHTDPSRDTTRSISRLSAATAGIRLLNHPAMVINATITNASNVQNPTSPVNFADPYAGRSIRCTMASTSTAMPSTPCIIYIAGSPIKRSSQCGRVDRYTASSIHAYDRTPASTRGNSGAKNASIVACNNMTGVVGMTSRNTIHIANAIGLIRFVIAVLHCCADAAVRIRAASALDGFRRE